MDPEPLGGRLPAQGQDTPDISSTMAEALPSRLDVLSAMTIFQDLAREDVEALMDETPTSSAGKGTVFYGGADGPEVLFLLKSGKVELYRQSSEGKKLTLEVVDEGAIFGEISLIDQRLVGTWAMAIEDSVICSLGRHDIEALLVKHPTVGLRMVEVLVDRLQQTRDALEAMAFSDFTGRVAGLLLRLADPDTGVVEGYSHQDMASMVGCLRESFTAVLDRFKSSGTVAVSRKRIEIVDRAKLERVLAQRSSVRQ